MLLTGISERELITKAQTIKVAIPKIILGNVTYFIEKGPQFKFFLSSALEALFARNFS
jgi:hypothetical protein